MARSTPQFIEDERQPEEWLQAADALAQRVVQTDARTAWARVCAGDYEGTPFAGKLSQLMFLAGANEPFSHAAE